jgi:hypothetical protein
VTADETDVDRIARIGAILQVAQSEDRAQREADLRSQSDADARLIEILTRR